MNGLWRAAKRRWAGRMLRRLDAAGELGRICAGRARVDHQFALPWEPSHAEVLLKAIADPDNADAVIDRANYRAA